MNKIFKILIFVFNVMALYGCQDNASKNLNTNTKGPQEKQVSCSSSQYYDRFNNTCIDNCRAGEKYDFHLNKCVPSTMTFDNAPTNEQLSMVCTGNSIYNSKDNACTPGLPLRVFSKDKSILYNWRNESNLSVCIDVDDEIVPQVSDEVIAQIATNIRKGIDEWLAPLIQENYSYLKLNNKIFIYKTLSMRCKPTQEDITIHVSTHESLMKNCHATVACSSASTRQIWLTLEKELPTYVHELGHLFGFEDHYTERGSNPCLDGYAIETTVMCVADTTLKAADKEGIKRQYCRFWPQDQKCSHQNFIDLTDIANGPLVTCNIPSLNRSISIINNYTDTTIRLTQLSDEKILKTYPKMIFQDKLNSSLWHFITHTEQGDVSFEIDWSTKHLRFEDRSDEEPKFINAEISQENVSPSGPNQFMATCTTEELPPKYKL